jgi:CheY-like chemotaxis protein
MIRAASPALLNSDSIDCGEHRRAPNVVVVDPRFDAYATLAASARVGRIGLHFRSSGAEAMRLARRVSVDAWLIAAELDDMSGHDLVRLLEPMREQNDGTLSKVAVVEHCEPGGRRWSLAESEAMAAGADSVVSHPISLADLEQLLGLSLEERSKVLAPRSAGRSFVTLPIGVGAAVVALAVLFMG